MGEVLFIDQGVRHRRVRYTIGRTSNLDEGFGQPGAPQEVRSQVRPKLFREIFERFVYREAAAGSARLPVAVSA